MTTPEEEEVVGNHLRPEERDLEAPPEDAAEQARPADPGQERTEPHLDAEVSEWDAIEQSRVVEMEDDYR